MEPRAIPDLPPAREPAAAPPAACLNCGLSFAGAAVRPNYCAHCGQETNVKPPTLMEFAQQFGGSYVAAEGALWRTLRLLLTRPGALTREYLDGRRKRYVLPLRLYLTISLLVLLAVRTVAVVDLGGIEERTKARAPRVIAVQFGVSMFGLREGVFFCERLPDVVCARLRERLASDPVKVVRQLNGLARQELGNLGPAMFVMLPAFAAWLRLAWWRRRLRFTEHLVFALHLHAFWFLMLGLALVDWAPVGVAAAVAVPVYAMLAMRRVYGGRWGGLLLRAGAVGLAYAFTLALTMSFIFLGLLLFG